MWCYRYEVIYSGLYVVLYRYGVKGVIYGVIGTLCGIWSYRRVIGVIYRINRSYRVLYDMDSPFCQLWNYFDVVQYF